MLRSYVTKKHLFFYFIAIMITWLEAIITPALIQYIVSSFLPITSCICYGRSCFGDCWKSDSLAGYGGKRYYYARVLTDFKSGIKKGIFQTFLYSRRISG